MSEFQELSTGFVPRNSNPRVWVARQEDILGGFHQYATLEDLIALHPNKMIQDMEIVVSQHTRGTKIFNRKKFQLKTVPTEADYPLSLTTTDGNYYQNFWEVIAENKVSESGVYEIEYAPDVNGVKPAYPYIDNPGGEVNWSNTYEAGTSKWYRERFSNDVDSGTGIYTQWTVPLPLNGNFESGDYVANLFLRAASEPPLPGRYDDNGLLNNEPAGWLDIPPGGANPLYEIRAQKDLYGNLKTDWIGPFLIPEDEDLVRYNSQSTPNPNNLVDQSTPATNPSAADTALTDAGWVKTFDPSIHNYRAIRQENAPNDYTLWDITKIAEESGEYIDRIYKLFPENQDFDDATFIANNTPTGNNPIENPTGAAENVGWADTQHGETDTEVNCYSEARKFIDGSLKTTWSSPRPFTGKSVYADYIESTDNTFKYPSPADMAAGTNSDPASITMTFKLFKGTNEITTGITYKWYKVYNNKSVIVVDPDVDPPLATTQAIVITPSDVDTKAIYRCYATLAVSGADDIVFTEEEFVVDITDGDDAKALVLGAETPIVVYDTVGTVFPTSLVKLIARQNFLDGTTFYWYKDNGVGTWIPLATFASGSISSVADAGGGQLTITTSAAHGLSDNDRVNITGTTNYDGAYTITNTTGTTFEITATWVATETGSWDQDFYTLTNQTLQINTDDLFLSNGAAQSARFAISTSSTAGNVENSNEFYDIATVSKLGSAGVGSDGADAITIVLSNEVDAAVIDRATGLPVAGEIGSSGRVKTVVTVYQGTTALQYGVDYTITGAGTGNMSDTANVTWGQQANGNNGEIYIDAWTNTNVTKVNITIPVNVTGIGTINKNFTVDTTLDAAGALIAFLEIDSTSTNQSLSFTPANRNDIVLKAVLDQNGTAIPEANFDGNVVWKFGTLTTATNLSGTNNVNKTVTRLDVVGSQVVTAEITYNTITYTTPPITIDDITDAKTYRLFYDYGSDPVPAEPITKPAAPADTLVANFTSTFSDTITTTNWYRDAGDKTYFVVDGLVTPDVNGDDEILWGTPYRVRGEVGNQGDSPDFLVSYYIGTATSTPPSIAPSNASRDTMLSNSWLPTPNGIVSPFIWRADNTFNGSDIDNTAALAQNNWGVTLYNSQEGRYIEYRYQGSNTLSYSGFDNADRNAGTGWSTTKPSLDSFTYVYETGVYIEPGSNNIIGTWSTPVLVNQNFEQRIDVIEQNYLDMGVANGLYVKKSVYDAAIAALQETTTPKIATFTDLWTNDPTVDGANNNVIYSTSGANLTEQVTISKDGKVDITHNTGTFTAFINNLNGLPATVTLGIYVNGVLSLSTSVLHQGNGTENFPSETISGSIVLNNAGNNIITFGITITGNQQAATSDITGTSSTSFYMLHTV